MIKKKALNITKNEALNIVNFLEYVLVISIILECNTIYSQLYGIHYIIRGALCLTTLISTIGICLIKKKIKINKCVLLFIIAIMMIMLIKTRNRVGIIILLLPLSSILFSLFLLFYNYGYDEIKKIFKKIVKIVTLLAIISLMFWIFGSLFNIIKPTGTIKFVWGKPYSIGQSYFYIHFNSPGQTAWSWGLFNSTVYRNTGIFTEAPMYSFVLATALLFNMWLPRNKENIRNEIILVIATVTTFFFFFIICALLILIYRFLEYTKKIKSSKNKKIIYIATTIFIIGGLFFSYTTIQRKMSVASTQNRILDLKNGFSNFLNNPIIGNGINSPKPSESNPEIGYGYSNAIIPILNDGGIILFGMYFLPFAIFCHWMNNNKIKKILTILIGAIFMFTILIQYRLLFILYLSLGFSLINFKQLKTKR